MPSLRLIYRRYQERLDRAYAFAEGTEGPAWNGMFEMGLAMAGLTMIPFGSQITREIHWRHAPKPKNEPGEPPDWEPSWIAEIDAFDPKGD